MNIDQQVLGTLELEEIKELCRKWSIPFEPYPTTRMLQIGRTLGPVDPARLPTQLEARADIQRVLNTYMRSAHSIIRQFWDEEE